MSEKGKQLYEDRVENFKTRLLRTWTQVHRSLDYYPPPGTSVNSCERLFAQLEESYKAYDAVVNDFIDYLTRTSTIESNIEIIKLHGQHEGKKELYLEFCEKFNKEKLNIETSSKRTAFTQRSKGSARMDSLLAAKQANVQAARARVIFTQKEAAMRREQAIIEENERVAAAAALRRKAEFETELLLLSQQKEVACAQAEAEAFEQYSGGSAKHSLPDLPESNPMQRVEQFVNAIKTENELKMEPVPEPTRLKPVSVPPGLEPVPVSTKLKPVTVLAAAQPEPSPVVWDFEEFKPMDAHASRTEPPRDAVTDFTQYLLKKDLLLSRLTFFDDKPENYVMWKTGFKSIVTELGVTSPLEELDLLIKWLGSVSSKQAVSIRASNASDPLKGLRRIWERLDERYGSPEIIEDALKKKLQKFPRLTVKDNKPLYELFDIVSEIESVKEDPKYSTLLSYFDSSAGVSQIVEKLPYNLKEKWVARASSYKETHHVYFPPFSFFVKFIGDMSRIRNDPSFYYENEAKVPKEYTPRNEQPRNVFTRKTDILPKPVVDRQCPLHGTNHELDDCRAFKLKTLQERRNFLKENYLCFKCAKTSKHRSKDCTEKVKCRECGSDKHPTALHVTPHPKPPHRNDFAQPEDTHGGEKGNTNQPKSVETKCTQVCSSNGLGKSCAKICLVKLYSNEQPEECIIGYAVIDDQSNRSLARSSLFDRLDLGDNEIEYTLSSCGGKTVSSGRVTSSCIVESLEGSRSFKIGSLLECDQIPDERDEIPTPEVARCHAHLRDIQKEIPPLNENAEILILIGRDCIEAHHVLDQRIGPPNAPYAQRIALGWVVIGEACLGKVHRTDSVNVNKTFLLSNGRPSVFTPCLNEFKVVESKGMNPVRQDGLFEISENDDVPAMSVEDREFVSIMDSEFRKDASGNWSAPLPFRSPRPKLPNNRQQAVRRAKALDASFRKDPLKKEHFITFMDKVFQNGHAELAPSLKPGEECWYLPIFGVYHPQKPGQIRAVFDSSAKYEDISLNNAMLQGPDSTNSLLGILIRFRREPVAITADIQQMFYCFKVEEKHRNFLRFLWYKDNNLDNPLTEYRMCVHVFGNSPSPAIATYGLRKTVENCDTDVKEFVNRDFYVDDGVTSKRTENQAIDLLKRTKHALEDGNLRLHKIASNSKNVMKAFPPEDLAKELKDIDFENDDLPAQRSLGVKWDLSTDSFSFSVSEEKQPLSRRQVLSTINSIFDPLGFLAPVTIQGKLIMREIVAETSNWDESLSTTQHKQWTVWRDSIESLKDIQIPRTYTTEPLDNTGLTELHVFSDASEQAIAAVAYLVTGEKKEIGFVLGKAKVAPVSGHTIPRLELCAAVLAVEVSSAVVKHLGMDRNCVKYYTDSKVVLGYIYNRTKRFFTYVSNRAEKIRKGSQPKQWRYIPTHLNPADSATRGLPAEKLQNSLWLTGPREHTGDEPDEIEFPIVNPDQDREIRQEVKPKKTNVSGNKSLGSSRFERCSSWKRLIGAIARLKHIASSTRGIGSCKGWHICTEARTVEAYKNAEVFVLREVQSEMYAREISSLEKKVTLPKDSPIAMLDPFIDQDGLLKVGGRLSRSHLTSDEKHPTIVPGKHHIAILLVRHYHESVKHQGRHFTEGAVRAAGYWIIGGKRLISSLIFKCVGCRKLRGRFECQKMSDLPSDRLKTVPPFTYVGVDTFGPWQVVSRRTRGGQANSKRWAILFTCLSIRAIHIEVVEDMSSSAFINALRRFIALRGQVKQFRSDRGTNFVGATDAIGAQTVNVEDGKVGEFLYTAKTVWLFNPPHSSHMGGVWERMIGVTRRILDSMLSGVRNLSHEVLVTLMAEVCAIVNSRPLVPVSTDCEVPEVLCPSKLLTFKNEGSEQPLGQFDLKDTYKSQWKHVQHLADTFWARWRRDYVQTLQTRRKWNREHANIQEGDVILLKDHDVGRVYWPIGRVKTVFPGVDGRIRKAEINIVKDGTLVSYIRPVVDMVLLVRSGDICDSGEVV